jgi:RNA polymerase sigma-70 factor (ECF subfamily)
MHGLPASRHQRTSPPHLVVVRTEESDRVLAELVLAGEEEAFRRLYRRHTPRLFMLVLRLLGGERSDAEDVVQDTWLRAVEQLQRFRWEASFGSWLVAIGINVARESLRRRGRRKEVDLEPALEPAPADPPERVEAVDLERAMAALPEGYRTVLVLHDVEGYTHEEIGARLGVTAGTSKSQLFHARRALRAALA